MHKQEALQSHSQYDVIRVCPEPLVVDMKEGTAIQRVVLDCRQIPHFSLYLCLAHTVGLWRDVYISWMDQGREDMGSMFSKCILTVMFSDINMYYI